MYETPVQWPLGSSLIPLLKFHPVYPPKLQVAHQPCLHIHHIFSKPQLSVPGVQNGGRDGDPPPQNRRHRLRLQETRGAGGPHARSDGRHGVGLSATIFVH